jgi:hypothetical protein
MITKQQPNSPFTFMPRKQKINYEKVQAALNTGFCYEIALSA